MSNPLAGAFSPATRKALYSLHAAVSGVLLCIGAYYTSTDAPVPNWLKGLTGVAVAAGTLLGATAASNVPTPDTDEAGGGGEAGEVGILGLVLILVVILLVFGLVR